MIDVYILGICLRSRCHVFLEVLPNSSASTKKEIFFRLWKVLVVRKNN